jgi:hypothetical protein
MLLVRENFYFAITVQGDKIFVELNNWHLRIAYVGGGGGKYVPHMERIFWNE